jgi:hypothetical protein
MKRTILTLAGFAILTGAALIAVACATQGNPICRCASDCGESAICITSNGDAVNECIGSNAPAGSCIDVGEDFNDAGAEPPEVEPELFDLLWTKRDLMEIEPDSSSDSTASDSASSDSSLEGTSDSTSSDSVANSASDSTSETQSSTSTASDTPSNDSSGSATSHRIRAAHAPLQK